MTPGAVPVPLGDFLLGFCMWASLLLLHLLSSPWVRVVYELVGL